MSKHILFSNYHWENDEFGKDSYDYAREYLFEEYGNENEWETADDIPDERVNSEVYLIEECDWDNFREEFGNFIEKSNYGFLLCGSVGRWNGTAEGGLFVKDFDDLYRFWKDCDYIKVYDEGGHLHIECSHHDGTNYGELKELTNKGKEYSDNHYYDYSDRELHEKLWNSNFYTKLPHYAHKVWGCKKGA